MFSKILVANRGEVAVRIIRACRELSIRTVAVYSSADANALHVKLADEAVCIGGPNPQESYLNIPSIVSAAEISDVEAIHPGYGFLAENAHFAEICESCDITFIGPSPETIRLMGDKVAAKDAMRKAGVPVIPGSLGTVQSKEEALKVAKRIKYPVMLKAAAGGGGRGMRVCHNDIRLMSAFLTCQTEAEAAFGKPDIFVERYIVKPRHVEIQLVADTRGHVIHLGERDCSIQRRHQKLIEESPSPVVDMKLRRKMGDISVRAAKAVGYNSIGTVEFLVDDDHNFYFMEMNTRIQVEHPVTEMVTGIDLLKQQIHIAMGEKLRIKQDDVQLKGCAIECRITAEDPSNGFTPSPGTIQTCQFPGGPNVRVDTHVYAGYDVPPFYDALLAKIIVYGRTRHEAIRVMQRALDECSIEPIKTTIPLHQRIFRDPTFLRGQVTTGYLDQLLGTSEDT